MWWWLFIAAVLAGIITVIAGSRVRVRVIYIKHGKDDQIQLFISALFGLVRFRYNVPMLALKPKWNGIRASVSKGHSGDEMEKEWSRKEMQSMTSNANFLLHNIKQYKQWLTGTLKHVHIHSFQWHTRFGLGDTPQTGIASGVFWGLKSSLIAALSRWVTFDVKPNVDITPLYQEEAFHTDVNIRASIQVYHLLKVFWMLLWRLLRQRGGLRVWYNLLIRKNTVDSPSA